MNINALQIVQYRDKTKHLSNWIISHWLPVGWIALLTGMFWVGERPYFHKLFYAGLAAPTLIALILQPTLLRKILAQPLIVLFLVFTTYILTSVLWAETDETPLSVIKRPLYIFLLLASVILISQKNNRRMSQVLESSALIAAISSGLTVIYFIFTDFNGRLSGYGALYNPLLSAHVFGFFFTYWLCRWSLTDKHFSPQLLGMLAFLWIAIMLTGSRTPLTAIFACIIWISIAEWRPKLLLFISAAGLSTAVFQMLHSSSDLLARGMSFRPAIWQEALRQLSDSLWIGLGYTHPMIFWIDGLDYALADTHNIELGVLFCGGIIGLTLWMAMYGYAAYYSWMHRKTSAVLIASSLVVFGFVAGLTEGSAFFSRPKEHWFLIWIPLALLAATRINLTKRAEKPYAISEKA